MIFQVSLSFLFLTRNSRRGETRKSFPTALDVICIRIFLCFCFINFHTLPLLYPFVSLCLCAFVGVCVCLIFGYPSLPNDRQTAAHHYSAAPFSTDILRLQLRNILRLEGRSPGPYSFPLKCHGLINIISYRIHK